MVTSKTFSFLRRHYFDFRSAGDFLQGFKSLVPLKTKWVFIVLYAQIHYNTRNYGILRFI